MAFSKYALFGLLFVFSAAANAFDWKGIFIAGDHSIDNFDNGRIDLTYAFNSKGELATLQLSSSEKFVSAENQVYPATSKNIVAAFQNLKNSSPQACLIHMTSHGIEGQGFYLSRAGALPPDALSNLINSACGEVPTVVLVSACYSGQFITEEIKGPNRVILTAAKADRPSFGCSPDTRYTYWDGCLLEEVPQSNTWSELYQRVNACVTAKESVLGVRPSEPQAYFGENTSDWKILH